MQVYDVVAAVLVVGLIIRGTRRGLVREAVEMSVLVVGVVVAFRFSPVVGSIVSGMANVPYEVARIVAAVVIFLVLVVGGALAARTISAAMKIVPGATLLNRFGGAALGAAYGVLLLVVGTTLLSVVPVSSGLRLTLDESIEASAVGTRVRDPEGLIQKSLSFASGEGVFATVIAVQDAVGSRLAAGTALIPLPDVGDAALPPSQVAAQTVFDAVNLRRVEANLNPLGWSSDLAVVAVARAGDVYRSGTLAVDDDLASSLAAQGVPGTINADMVVLAATPNGLIEAFIGANSYKTAILDTRYRKAGVGVIQGPFGLLAVLVLSS